MTKVYEWGDLADDVEFGSLLLGNGASVALWEEFKYDSLFTVAQTLSRPFGPTGVAHPLSPADIGIFDQFETRNFETVLSALNVASRVMLARGEDSTALDDAYERIQTALGESIRGVHVPWDTAANAAGDVLTHLATILREYEYVYTTNYDLLVYWAMMAVDAKDFADFFWNPRESTTYFDLTTVGRYDARHDWTKVLYLHGALHLISDEDEITHKRKKREFQNLLDQFGAPVDGLDTARPLFVTEGSSADKMRAIRRSEYLSYAYQRFVQDSSPLVVFGHGLTDADAHIRDAIKASPRLVAVSFRSGVNDPTERYNFLHAWMPSADIRLFEASTHPLGDPNLALG